MWTILSLKLDQLFMLLVPLLVEVVCDIKSPNELELVQWVLSILSHFVAGAKSKHASTPLIPAALGLSPCFLLEALTSPALLQVMMDLSFGFGERKVLQTLRVRSLAKQKVQECAPPQHFLTVGLPSDLHWFNDGQSVDTRLVRT
jgi:hypothetical protein